MADDIEPLAGATPGDSLPYPTDYEEPADSPNALQDLAEATQTALNKRATPTQASQRISAVITGPGGSGSTSWGEYRTITAVDPAWQAIGAWAEFSVLTIPGTWVISCHAYLDVTGGTSSPCVCWLGLEAVWAEGGTLTQGNPTVGRLTSPPQTRIVTNALAVAHITNVTNKRLRVRPVGQTETVAGSAPKVGIARVTAEFRPYPSALPINGYAP